MILKFNFLLAEDALKNENHRNEILERNILFACEKLGVWTEDKGFTGGLEIEIKAHHGDNGVDDKK